MTIGEKVKLLRETKGWTQEYLSELTSLSIVYISYLENNQRKNPRRETLEKLSEAFNVSIDALLSKESFYSEKLHGLEFERKIRESGMTLIPLISWVQAGDWKEGDDTNGWVWTDEKGKDLFALKVKGDSMVPEFLEGDTIIIHPHLKIKSDDFVIVRNSNKKSTFKQIKKYNKTFVLHSLNPKYDDEVIHDLSQYFFIGKVIKKLKSYR